ncbi:MAG TPA: AAA family ATPase [Solirubrobacteraceae bacterium]|jgi:Mrp family chromosome partitioning ATPase|nr:AAA family ATPase [Solirubrobacteraceae bacterium]
MDIDAAYPPASNLAARKSDPQPLLERDRELAWISGAISAAKAGAGRLLIVEGDPGAGKSSVLAHAAAAASVQGLQVLDARGGVFEQATGLGAARQLFETVLAKADSERLTRLLDGAAAMAGPRCLPQGGRCL